MTHSTAVTELTLPDRWRRWLTDASLPSRALFVAVATANLILAIITVSGFFVSDAGYDWNIFTEAGRRAIEGGLYRWEGIYAWSYSPLLAYGFVVLAPLGFAGWSLLHVLALRALRDRWLAIVTLLSWPFWADVYNGNTMVFVFVAAVAAVRGSRIGTGAYLLLALLMPRPLMLPLLVWVLWTQPAWRARFLLMLGAYVLLVLATGQATEWVRTLTSVTGAVAVSSRDIGPSVILGSWWLVPGVLLAIFLTVLRRPGLASLAASPYWLPQYLLMALVDVTVPAPSAGKE